MNELLVLKRDVGKCLRCDLSKSGCGDSTPMGGKFVGKPELFLLIEHPAIDNAILDDFSVSLSDKLLDKFIKECGITNYYITYTMKCVTDDTYKKHHLESCYTWLIKELQTVKPKAIITFGTLPIKSLFPQIKQPKMKDLAYNTVMAEPFAGYKVKTFIEYSPNFLLQNGIKVYNKAVEKTKKFLGEI